MAMTMPARSTKKTAPTAVRKALPWRHGARVPSVADREPDGLVVMTLGTVEDAGTVVEVDETGTQWVPLPHDTAVPTMRTARRAAAPSTSRRSTPPHVTATGHHTVAPARS